MTILNINTINPFNEIQISSIENLQLEKQDIEEVGESNFGNDMNNQQLNSNQKINSDGVSELWSNEDIDSLVKGVETHGRKWKKISKRVFNGRKSPSQCFAKFRLYSPKRITGPWTEEEVQKLLNTVKKYGKRWPYISSNTFQGTRSPNQCRIEFQYIIKNKNIKVWNTQKDQKLKNAVETYGHKWIKIAKEIFKGDVAAWQCKARFQVINFDSNSTNWSKEEDNRLIEAYKTLKNKWTQISKEYLGGTRTPHQCKMRYIKIRDLSNL